MPAAENGMSFTLGDHLTTRQLVAALANRGIEVSDQTILNYVNRDKMPFAGRDSNSAYLFDAAEVEKWILANRRAGLGKGGKRDGAGRKGTGSEPVKPVDAPPAETKVGLGAVFADDARRRAILEDMRHGVDPISLISIHGFTPTDAKLLKDAFDAHASFLDLAEREGKLVRADELLGVLGDLLGFLGEVHINLPSSIAAELAGVLKLDAAGQERVRSLVDAEVQRIRERLREHQDTGKLQAALTRTRTKG